MFKTGSDFDRRALAVEPSEEAGDSFFRVIKATSGRLSGTKEVAEEVYFSDIDS